MRNVIAVVDGAGIYGYLLHYAMTVFFVGSAFIIFVYLWRRNRLDMDEEPKLQMMRSEAMPEQEEISNDKRR